MYTIIIRPFINIIIIPCINIRQSDLIYEVLHTRVYYCVTVLSNIVSFGRAFNRETPAFPLPLHALRHLITRTSFG